MATIRLYKSLSCVSHLSWLVLKKIRNACGLRTPQKTCTTDAHQTPSTWVRGRGLSGPIYRPWPRLYNRDGRGWGGGLSSVWGWGGWAWACGWGLGLGTGDLGLWLNSGRAHHPSMCFGYHNRAKATSNLDTSAVKWKHQTPFGAAFSAGASTRTRTHTPHVHGPSQLTTTAASPTAACSFTSAPTRTSSGHAQSHQHGHSFGSMNQRGP